MTEHFADLFEDWSSKVVYVYLRNAGESLHSGIAIRDAKMQTLDGRRFVVGRGLSDPRDWTGDLPMLVSWDDIIHIVIISSPEEFLRRWHRAQEYLARTSESDDTTQ